MRLPIAQVLPELRAALALHPLALLQAPPGAGKSTGLPLELLAEPWLAGQTILLLQPRRVAARAVAARLAQTLGEQVGDTVGLRVRFEQRVSAATRLEVITEGILLRRLQRDPELSGVGLVIFDEFHERSLDADLGLALLREVQAALRSDLRVLVMSATLDSDLSAKLSTPESGRPPLVVSEGRSYPVSIRYLPADPTDPVAAMPAAIVQALGEPIMAAQAGDILAFLPGVGEIRRVQRALQGLAELQGVEVLPLYGDLPVEAQQKVISPSNMQGETQGSLRRVILATSIAETSLTIAGVRVVIDSGLARVQQYDPGRSLSRLVTTRLSRDSADQRAGRAGRLAAGVAYRLWSERTHANLPAARPPEILVADLTPLRLEVAGWGSAVGDLPWLDAPPALRLQAAEQLLMGLGALEPDTAAVPRITLAGRELLSLPTHPRLANMLRGAQAQGLAALGADLAALLEERDPLPRGSGSDISARQEALRRDRAGSKHSGDKAVLERVERLSRQWRKLLGMRAADPSRSGSSTSGSNTADLEVTDPYAVGRLLLLAYPERAAQLRTGSRTRYLLSGGQGVELDDHDPLAGRPYLLAAQLDMSGGQSGSSQGRVFLAAELNPADLPATLEQRVEWDGRTGSLKAQEEQRYGALVLSSRPLSDIPDDLRLDALQGALRQEGLSLLNWTDEARQWQARVLSLRQWRPTEPWPGVSDGALLADLSWLAPFLTQVRRREDFARVPLLQALGSLLSWPLPRQLDHLAPTHLTVPSGHSIRLEYRAGGEAPILAVKLQELFGLADTPTVNEGRTPVLLHLLSPARRPVQITQDLRSFWQGGYFEVRKDLRGQYPKHPWPDDPWTAIPTRAIKKRM